ncbi:ABC transporter permease [Candidatus Bipolaricaulota bacterium]|nr:ABC transporter permease [Candidatus Bipolaricaulota bacterium]
MTALVKEMRGAYAFVERNVNLMKRYWGWEIVWLIYSLTNALAITYIGNGMSAISGQEIDTQFVVKYLLVGALIWQYLSVIFYAISEMIAWERWEGTIEYTFMAPVSRPTHLVGTTLFAIGYGIVRTLVILGLVTAFFRLDLAGANIVGAVLMLLAGSVSFVGLGIVAAVLPLLYPERGAQMTNAVAAILLLISGVYYPIETLPAWLQPIAKASPATYVIRGMRTCLLDGGSTRKLLPTILVLIGIGLAIIVVGLVIFRYVETYAKRTGRLKRSG